MVDMAWHLHSHHVSCIFLRPTMASKISCGQLWPVKYTPLVGYFEVPCQPRFILEHVGHHEAPQKLQLEMGLKGH